MPSRPTGRLYEHISLAFLPEDKEIFAHCARESGLSQTELIRRLTRHYAGGGVVIGCVKIKLHPAAKAWAGERAVK